MNSNQNSSLLKTNSSYKPAPAVFSNKEPSLLDFLTIDRQPTSNQSICRSPSARRNDSQDLHYKASITLAAFSFILLAWPALICIIPAVMMSRKALELEAEDDALGAKSKRRIVRILNIIGLAIIVETVVGYFAICLFMYFLYLN